jgi:Transposase DDE domain
MNETAVRYRVSNWRDYNQSLIERGNIELWFNDSVLAQWTGPAATGRRGRPRIYSDLAMQCLFALRLLYQLPLRATQGLFISLLRLLDCPLTVPNYSTLCRRQARLTPGLAATAAKGARHVLIDSTGLKVFGEGEWKRRTHGKSKRRTWRKLHLAIDAKTREIVATRLTEASVHDGEVLSELLLQVQGKIRKVTADGAYDTWECRYEVHLRDAEATIPPRENAVPAGCADVPPVAERDQAIGQIKQMGLKAWKQQTGYSQRSLAETTMFRVKATFGEKMKARVIQNQVAEAVMKSHILNRFIQQGLPKSTKVAVE